MKFHENLSAGSPVVQCGQTEDGRTDTHDEFDVILTVHRR